MSAEVSKFIRKFEFKNPGITDLASPNNSA